VEAECRLLAFHASEDGSEGWTQGEGMYLVTVDAHFDINWVK